MRRLLLGLLLALAASIGFSLLTSLTVCLGANPAIFQFADGFAPLLGIFTGAWIASRGGSWKAGALIGLVFVVAWLEFWMYAMGRWNPLLWMEEGLPRLTLAHLAWWGAALATGILGGLLRKIPAVVFAGILALLFAGVLIFANVSLPATDFPSDRDQKGAPTDEQFGPEADGTTGYLHTFDFHNLSKLNVGIYDCDSDEAAPYDNSNTTYMGQDLAALLDKLNDQQAIARRQILCLINGGFFGASGWSVAHHEEPLVENGRALYNVDTLRPKDQAWFFAINSPNAVLAGRPRFSMPPSIPWDQLTNYQTVLGGVRPLISEGHPLELRPGAGVTTLKCSRTSIGWTADGGALFVLTVFDPDGELASAVQRKMGATQTGGWDATQVQKFWEDRHVPFALLFDGGESTQLAFRRPDGQYTIVPSGYQYSFTTGYLFRRPLRFTLPILPPSQAHRGVLNYFYIDGPANELE